MLLRFLPLALGLPGLLVAQSAVALGAPTATSRETFTEITGLVELGSGGVLVGDAVERRLVHLDLDRGTSRPVSSIGSGPTEYRTFGALLPTVEGGAVVTDFSQRRILPIGPDATPSEVRPYRNALGNILRAIDDGGRIYSVAFVPRTGNAPQDSMDIIRWDPSSGEIDTLMRFDAGVSQWTGRGPLAAVQAVDAWVVRPDGQIVILDAVTYQITVYADGRAVRSGRVPFVPVPFTAADRREHEAYMVRNPVRTMGRPASGANRPELEFRYPTQFPAFVRDGARIDRQGRIWVERSRSLTDSVAVFDVIGPALAPVARVALPRRATLAGFGRNSVYLAVPNGDDELRIQRHPLPAIGGP